MLRTFETRPCKVSLDDLGLQVLGVSFPPRAVPRSPRVPNAEQFDHVIFPHRSQTLQTFPRDFSPFRHPDAFAFGLFAAQETDGLPPDGLLLASGESEGLLLRGGGLLLRIDERDGFSGG